MRYQLMVALAVVSVCAGPLLTACSSGHPTALQLRQALRLKLIDEALGVSNASRRLESLDQIRIDQVAIHHDTALPSGDHDLDASYRVTYRKQTMERSEIVTLTRHRGEWRVLSLRGTRS